MKAHECEILKVWLDVSIKKINVSPTKQEWEVLFNNGIDRYGFYINYCPFCGVELE